jgi:hypothetical protein
VDLSNGDVVVKQTGKTGGSGRAAVEADSAAVSASVSISEDIQRMRELVFTSIVPPSLMA